jgi:hypothetical protein
MGFEANRHDAYIATVATTLFLHVQPHFDGWRTAAFSAKTN